MVTHNFDTVVISDNAINLLERFHSGIDKMVFSLAEEPARNRRIRDDQDESNLNASRPGNVLEVEQEDVRFAAASVLKALDELSIDEKFKKMIDDELGPCYENRGSKR